jgi:hypothetical protein
MSTLPPTQKVQIYGIPGEEQNMLVMFSTVEHPFGSRPISLAGKFRVQFLLARPGRMQFSESQPTFLKDVVGDSHIGIAKPAGERTGDEDIIGMVLDVHHAGQILRFRCVPNGSGYVGKIEIESLTAADYMHAERIAYEALMPFLSAWSLTLDIPVFVETIQVTDLTTHTDMLKIRSPFVEMKPAGGVGSLLSEEFCQYASLYREGMNANSPFYRLLCFYKIIESLYLMRNEKAKEAKSRGIEPRKYSEDVPLTEDAIRGLIGLIYPWRATWDDDFTIHQVLPDEAKGKRFKAIREKTLEPLRDRIVHALMKSGKIESVADRLTDVNGVILWLPLLRLWTRLLLRIEFPTEFEYNPLAK